MSSPITQTLKDQLADQQEITSLWAQGYEIDFPAFKEPYSPWVIKNTYSLVCIKCGQGVTRYNNIKSPVCGTCQVEKQRDRNHIAFPPRKNYRFRKW